MRAGKAAGWTGAWLTLGLSSQPHPSTMEQTQLLVIAIVVAAGEEIRGEEGKRVRMMLTGFSWHWRLKASSTVPFTFSIKAMNCPPD